MLMSAIEVDQGDERVVILGPCPGCHSWQLDYTRSLCFGFEHPEWLTLIEGCLQDHHDECAGLRKILSDTP